MNKKLIAIIVALLVAAGAVTYITQQKEPVEPTISEVETPVEQPVSPTVETPKEEAKPIETIPTPEQPKEEVKPEETVVESETPSTGETTTEEEQKQETPVEEGTVGSDTGSNVGTGTGNGSGSVVSGSVGEGNNIPTQNPDGTLDASNVKPQTPVDQESLRQEVESKESTEKVLGYNAEVGGVEIVTDTGRQQVVLPGGAAIDKELLDILKQYGK